VSKLGHSAIAAAGNIITFLAGWMVVLPAEILNKLKLAGINTPLEEFSTYVKNGGLQSVDYRKHLNWNGTDFCWTAQTFQ
jgi:hypothetical protein